MPIQFNCNHCQKLLRVPDNSAGKNAACPACGATLTIPGTQPSPPVGSVNTGSIDPLNSFGQQPAQNPYPSPTMRPGNASMTSAAPNTVKILGPAIGMSIGSILSLLYMLFVFAVGFTAGWEEIGFEPPQDNPAERTGYYIGFFGVLGFMMIMSLAILAGAIAMATKKSYSMAMAAAICSLLPCQCGCLITLPFGIWGIVSLVDSAVKAEFRR